MFKIGEILGEKYRLIGYLGQGKWGRVYLAEHVELGNKWAVKSVDLTADPRVNLLAEPGILKKLNHPSLPRIIDIIKTDRFLLIVEDYFEGFTLKELIIKDECCSEENVLEWGKQLCEILIYLHSIEPKPIIYRDMKPGNIIINDDNRVKLIDFGIAREYNQGRESDSTFIGTIGYAAPEQYFPQGKSDVRTDIYGLGVTLYHALTGLSPTSPDFRMIPLRDFNPILTPFMEKIISRCVENDPNKRYQSVRELMADLNATKSKKSAKISGLVNRLKAHLWTSKQEQIVLLEKFFGTVLIAVGGSGRGVGCTYTAIGIAAFLGHHKYKVALVELNEHPALQALEREGSVNEVSGNVFQEAGVDFFWQNCYSKDVSLITALSADYNYVVVDLGCVQSGDEKSSVHRSPWYAEMLRADLTLLVAGAAVWQLKDLFPLLRNPDSLSWNIIFTIPDPLIFDEMQRQIHNKSYATVFNPDPFKAATEQEYFFKELLQQVLPKKTNRA